MQTERARIVSKSSSNQMHAATNRTPVLNMVDGQGSERAEAVVRRATEMDESEQPKSVDQKTEMNEQHRSAVTVVVVVATATTPT